ncbi:MATE family efflux transporter [[Mycoplasma] testudinis]|uniref:MATE family efflux transporter n=1 Tax=[Mycoplasma] testudinis TaxID=33924 RepID=UPI00048270F0|nr:MATE family efflux transporter [[Mycoplasma] testudinis]
MRLGSSKSPDRQARAKRLFAEMPIRKSIWLIAIPGLLTYFFVGLYSFLDQVLIQILVPQSRSIADVYAGVYGGTNVFDDLNTFFSSHNITAIPNFLADGSLAGSGSNSSATVAQGFSPQVIAYFSSHNVDITTSPIIPIFPDLFTGPIGSGMANRSEITPTGVASNAVDVVMRSLQNGYNTSHGFDTNNIQSVALTDVSIIARQAVNSFSSVTLIANAILFIVPLGASVYYTKAISYSYEDTGRNIWGTAFWMSVFLCLIGSLITLLMTGFSFQRAMVGTVNLDNVFGSGTTAGGTSVLSELSQTTPTVNSSVYVQAIGNYQNDVADISGRWGQEFSYVYSGGLVIAGTYSVLSYFIRAEGKNNFVTYWALISNVINVILDFVFIRYANLGSLGSGLATLCGWIVLLFAYVSYILYAYRRNKTWLSVSSIFKFHFNSKIVFPSIALGGSSFLRTIGFAIIVIAYNQILINIAGQDFQVYHASSLPIMTLFFYALFGVSDGARPAMSYNYSLRNIERCRQVYWWTMIVSFSYAILAYVIVASAAEPFLTIFGFQYPPAAGSTVQFNNAQNIYNAAEYLRILMLRALFFAVALPGMTLFQGTSNIPRSTISTSMEGFFVAYIIFGIFYGISIAVGRSLPPTDNTSKWVFVSGYAMSALISGSAIFGMSIRFLYHNMKPEILAKPKKKTKLAMLEVRYFTEEAMHHNLPTPEAIQQHGLEQALHLHKSENQLQNNPFVPSK